MPRYKIAISRYRTLSEIEDIASSLGAKLKLHILLPFLRFNLLCEILPKIIAGFELRAVPDHELEVEVEVEAKADCQKKLILIRQSLFARGTRGDPHALMVLLHELSHLVLGHNGIRCKVSGINIRDLRNKDERRDEWEANRLAGALCMPFELAGNCNSSKDLVRTFCVTAEAAKWRFFTNR